MRILAVTRAHNAGETLANTLDSLATFCDDIYAIDDRSTDDTAAILANHPAVTNVVRARADLPSTPWLIPESTGLELLYRMADFCRPDWIVMVDADWTFQIDVDIRDVLARTPQDVAALMCPMESRWDDPEYPDMVPVMGTAEALRGPFWRWRPGLYAGAKLMHNAHWPANITDHGRIGQLDGTRLTHNGWSTLEERISRVRHYMRLDPDSRHNFGVAYDRSLLFGYALDEVSLLKADYQRRVRGDFDRIEPRARLPIEAEPRAIGRGYGPRPDGFHPGVDFAADPGSPIYAVISGTVCCAGDVDHLYSVTIAEGDTEIRYVFRPGDDTQIALGDRIDAGTRIGSIGAEDQSSDGFLHFETRVGRAHVNPLRYLGNMGLRPWPPPGRLRAVAGHYPPATPCTITADE
ncbi:peptidoglycan DD-metalloendopeptidase family protein [Mycobacterium sp. Aquia_216]|uniref:peptidoglycan DD-metalloendopeptidase family protein n=1 Tax=Mycobacterium sp. Aquia_216 TaxID=2991729 RepID=UPI00227ABBEB|nr:peptidoglycan DD-metalloendopeptidase family protein [Mycobacterium sp. Aquia_216]WAJ47586.1 peptidoglycan DD-metalloendopeptidase family protein [Mycobacterium sp. Aquia_216]